MDLASSISGSKVTAWTRGCYAYIPDECRLFPCISISELELVSLEAEEIKLNCIPVSQSNFPFRKQPPTNNSLKDTIHQPVPINYEKLTRDKLVRVTRWIDFVCLAIEKYNIITFINIVFLKEILARQNAWTIL